MVPKAGCWAYRSVVEKVVWMVESWVDWLARWWVVPTAVGSVETMAVLTVVALVAMKVGEWVDQTGDSMVVP